jgi:hypothetical protein
MPQTNAEVISNMSPSQNSRGSKVFDCNSGLIMHTCPGCMLRQNISPSENLFVDMFPLILHSYSTCRCPKCPGFAKLSLRVVLCGVRKPGWSHCT